MLVSSLLENALDILIVVSTSRQLNATAFSFNDFGFYLKLDEGKLGQAQKFTGNVSESNPE